MSSGLPVRALDPWGLVQVGRTAALASLGAALTTATVATRAGGVLLEAAAVLPRAVLALERLAASADSIDALGRLEPLLVRLAEAEGSALVEPALSALPDLPAAVVVLQDVVVQMQASLGGVAPDLQAVAEVIDRLDVSVAVLAGAVAPLQGTSERLGRLVDRLPERLRRPADAAALPHGRG